MRADPSCTGTIVSGIQDARNIDLGMKEESILYELDGRRGDGTEHERTLKLLRELTVPFYVVFQHVAMSSENDFEQPPYCYPSQEMISDAMTAIGQEEADLIFGSARNVEQSLFKPTIAVDIVRLVIVYHGVTGTKL